MSGGHFNYTQWNIEQIADEVEQLILDNDSNDLDEYGYTKGTHFSPETIIEFKTALETLRKAYVYAQRIDWLVSADDGEDSFHNRLKGELDALEKRNN
jgi:hypothetical protein